MNAVARSVGLLLVLAGCGDAGALDDAGGGGGGAGGGGSGVTACPDSASSAIEAECQVEGQSCTYCCDGFICGLVDPESGISPCQGNSVDQTFTCVDGQYEAPEALTGCDHDGVASCENDSDCRWLRPGCDAQNGFVEGCYPKADCTIDGCESTSQECRGVTLACADDTCECVEAETSVCLPL